VDIVAIGVLYQVDDDNGPSHLLDDQYDIPVEAYLAVRDA